MTGHWATLRQLVLSMRDAECEVCGDSKFKLRRITFERADCSTEEDVKLLCDDCHDKMKPIPFYEEYLAKHGVKPPTPVRPTVKLQSIQDWIIEDIERRRANR
jgi:hypothetical protein